MRLHIDVETYSPEDLRKSGVYRYTQHPDFEVLMLSYAYNDGEITNIALAQGEQLPKCLIKSLLDPAVEKHAHNASFERNALKAIGFDIPVEQWRCTMIKAAYCGLPLSLEELTKVLDLQDKGKLSTGKALIRYFCLPCKPTKVNGGRTRNLPDHDLEKWQAMREYCNMDVEAERAVYKILEKYQIPEQELKAYQLDQKINDSGVLVDLDLASKAISLNATFADKTSERLKELTNLENPNSPVQLTQWLSNSLEREINTIAKAELKALKSEANGVAKEVISLREQASKTSVKKYEAMINCVCADSRAHGVFQFYGANRTGRWAGRLIQLQNLPQNKMSDNCLDLARQAVKSNDYDYLDMAFGNIADTLSQLIRTAFVAPKGHTLLVSDFSAIEARVLAWLAGETWRLDVFDSHGKIYEASAAMMFNVPIETIGKGSNERQKGKVAELALGYQGGVGAMRTMGGEAIGLSETDMQAIVTKWRKASPNIVQFWQDVEQGAIRAVLGKKRVGCKRNPIVFNCDGDFLQIELPSGRSLFYKEPKIKQGTYGNPSLTYKGLDQTTKQWRTIDTYGGKLTENIVQAVSRDLLLESMFNLYDAGFNIAMHVHDEVVLEVPSFTAEADLKAVSDIMGQAPEWAKGLPLTADGYLTDYYKKD